jgi:hypothetical protein
MRTALLLSAALVLAAPAAVSAGSAAHPPTEPARHLRSSDIPSEALELALRAYRCAQARGLVTEPILTLIDYSRPSTERRLWVLDLDTGEVRFHELVAHGRESGENHARAFSNVSGSLQSSLGLFLTAETYIGRHGYSLRLDGLEPGLNDRARERAIVMHGADYATASFAATHGRLGRSWGCPALDPRVNRDLIDTIRGGTAVFAYATDDGWMADSSFLACAEPGVGSPILRTGASR